MVGMKNLAEWTTATENFCSVAKLLYCPSRSFWPCHAKTELKFTKKRTPHISNHCMCHCTQTREICWKFNLSLCFSKFPFKTRDCLILYDIVWYCRVLQGNSGKFQGIVICFIILTHIETRDLHSLINFEQLSLNSTSYHIFCYNIIIILYYILSYHLLSYHMLLNEYSPFQLVNYVSCF